MHPKNFHSLMSYKNIDIVTIDSIHKIDQVNLREFDCVYSPTDPIDVSKHPDTPFIFGPHFSVFPDKKLRLIKSDRTAYIILSDWVKTFWESYDLCTNLKLYDIPFAVDTERFCEVIPIQNRQSVFIYYKDRHPQELTLIEGVLKHNKISYKVFHYKRRYSESDYLDFLQHAKFGIWIGRHESQGFALEEALSCNVPLLVWNVRSMNQEYGQSYNDIPATSIPYWDERCGEFFYDMNDFKEKAALFFEKLETYNPREFVLETLSNHICEKRFIDIILELKQSV
jgi:hypothetical protein